MGLTKSGSNMGTSETKIEETPKQKEEQKTAQKIQDARTLLSYEFQIDNLGLEIHRIEEVLRLDLANRELRDSLKTCKEQLTRFKNLHKVIKQRMRK